MTQILRENLGWGFRPIQDLILDFVVGDGKKQKENKDTIVQDYKIYQTHGGCENWPYQLHYWAHGAEETRPVPYLDTSNDKWVYAFQCVFDIARLRKLGLAKHREKSPAHKFFATDMIIHLTHREYNDDKIRTNKIKDNVSQLRERFMEKYYIDRFAVSTSAARRMLKQDGIILHGSNNKQHDVLVYSKKTGIVQLKRKLGPMPFVFDTKKIPKILLGHHDCDTKDYCYGKMYVDIEE